MKQTKANRQEITYTAFDKAASIWQGNLSDPEQIKTLDITYGTMQERVKTVYKLGGQIKKSKIFVGQALEIEETSGHNIRQLHYVHAGDGLCAIYVTDEEGEDGQMFYIHKDYLGSYETISDETGTAIEKLNFDPWGRRRSPSNGSISEEASSFLFDRGFTGHEHLDEFGLINMNGRMYDPLLGRFLSPDNNVQAPELTQNLNRYSYCLNNPLIYTDPSGEFIFTALLTPIGLTPVGMILDAACWGATIDLGMQGIQMASGTRENIDWNQVGGAAVAGAVFGGMGLIAPSFTVTSTSFAKNLPTYLGKAGWAGLTGIASSGAGMLATDLFEGGGIDYSGEDYLRTMGMAGAFSFGLSFAGSMYDYASWDRFTNAQKMSKIQNKFGSNVKYDPTTSNAGYYNPGSSDVYLGPNALNNGKGYAFSSARHELKHFTDYQKYLAGKLNVFTRRGFVNHFEIRAYKMEMRYNRVTSGDYLGYINYIKKYHGYKGFGTFLPNQFMYYNTIF